MAVSPISSLLDFHHCPFPSSPRFPPRSSDSSSFARSFSLDQRPLLPPTSFLKRLHCSPNLACSSPLHRPSDLQIVAVLRQPDAQEASNPIATLLAFFQDFATQAGNVQEFVSERLQQEVCELARVAFLEACRLFGIFPVNEYLLQYSYGMQPQFAPTNVFLSSGNLPANLSSNVSGNGNPSGNGDKGSLSSILAGTAPTGNKWEDKARIRRMMEERGIKKEPGVSRIEVNGKTHTFMANDRNHPELKEIHRELDRVIRLMKEAGYEHDLRFVLHDISDEAKERALNCHSEKLAICYGFLMTPPKSALRIVKNLRVCGDCHTATKFMSKISQREIIVRDAFRFHHFKNGVCSCGDYW